LPQAKLPFGPASQDDLLTESAGFYECPLSSFPRPLAGSSRSGRASRKRSSGLKEDLARVQLKSLASEAKLMDGLNVVVQKMGSADIDALIKAATLLAEQDYVVMLGSDTGKLVAAVGKSGLERGVKAGDMIRAAAKTLGGGGGGRAELAQGGGPDVAKLDDALMAGLETMRAGA